MAKTANKKNDTKSTIAKKTNNKKKGNNEKAKKRNDQDAYESPTSPNYCPDESDDQVAQDGYESEELSYSPTSPNYCPPDDIPWDPRLQW
jgi:hypothetical protein